MTGNDWYEAGDQLKRLVQNAVDTGDFSQLGNAVADVVNDAMSDLQDVLRGNRGNRQNQGYEQTYDSCDYDQTYREQSYDNSQMYNGQSYDNGQTYHSSDYDGETFSGTAEGSYDRDSGTYRGSAERRRRAYGQAYGQSAARSSQAYGGSAAQSSRAYGQSAGQGSQAYGGSAAQNDRASWPVSVKHRVPGEFASKAMKYTGYGLGVVFGVFFGLFGALSASWFLRGLWGLAVLCGVFSAGSFAFGAVGQVRLGVSRRFHRYQEVLGERTYCMIEELASGIGGTVKYVKKDLKKMIRRGYFQEGYLDRKETLLITDKATYQQYIQAEESYAKRQSEQAAAQAYGSDAGNARAAGSAENTGNGNAQSGSTGGTAGEQEDSLKRTPEHQALIEEGQRYISHIRECNDKIPGEQMTAKLNRLELVVTRIFREAEKNPDSVSDLRKMMSYYLPTTRKLLDAYCELDDQPIRGQNIESTRKEIESALDTINGAFEKLLDDLYEEQAWDISSDISVLNSMLAQEGLTGKDFGEKGSQMDKTEENSSGKKGVSG